LRDVINLSKTFFIQRFFTFFYFFLKTRFLTFFILGVNVFLHLWIQQCRTAQIHVPVHDENKNSGCRNCASLSKLLHTAVVVRSRTFGHHRLGANPFGLRRL